MTWKCFIFLVRKQATKSSLVFGLVASLSFALFFSCNREQGPGDLDRISSACSQWCSSAYKSDGSRKTCARYCGAFVERFRACLEREGSCRKARKCAAGAMKKECISLDRDREICTLGAEYAYTLSLDYCIDQTEKL